MTDLSEGFSLLIDNMRKYMKSVEWSEKDEEAMQRNLLAIKKEGLDPYYCVTKIDPRFLNDITDSEDGIVDEDRNEELINTMLFLNLDEIGKGELADKHSALTNIISKKVVEGVQFKFDLFRKDWVNLEYFNKERSNIQSMLVNIELSEGQHGAINPDPNIYHNIRNDCIEKKALILASTLTPEQKAILLYILLPGTSLPNFSSDYNLDKDTGEKTFIKMILNLAIKTMCSRYDTINGYMLYFQQIHYTLNK